MRVIMIMAVTVDGKIGLDEHHFPDWTGTEDKRMFKQLTTRAGALIMGSKTFDTIGRPLPGRKNIVLTRNRSRRSEWENLVFTAGEPADILSDLEREGFSEVVLAGGARVNYLFARHRLIDEIIVTFAPKIFGSGISLFSDPVNMELKLEEFKGLGRDLICARYRVVK